MGWIWSNEKSFFPSNEFSSFYANKFSSTLIKRVSFGSNVQCACFLDFCFKIEFLFKFLFNRGNIGLSFNISSVLFVSIVSIPEISNYARFY